MKQSIHYLATLIALLTVVSIPRIVRAQEGSCGVGVTWRLDGNTLILSGEGEMYDYSSASGSSYYLYLNDIKELIVGPGITTIGKYAFNGFSSLEKIQFSEGLETIKEYAFQKCSELKNFTLPQSLTTIGDNAFSKCGMETLTVPKSLTSLGYQAFNSCSSLKTIYWNCNIPIDECEDPNHYTNYPLVTYSEYFNDCTLHKVYIGEGVRYIPNGLFYGAGSGGGTEGFEVITNGNLEYIGYNAFGDANVPSAEIVDGLKYIDKCLYSCAETYGKPTKVDVREGTVGLTRAIFLNNQYLTEVTLPTTLKYVGSGVFAQCASLSTLNYNVVDCVFWKFNWSYSGSSGNPFNSALSQVNFGDKVESLPDYLFYKCTGLREIVFPKSLTTIGSHCFSSCSGLTSVDFANVKNIKENAFYECDIKNLTLPETLEEIGNQCFWKIPNQQKVVFGENLKNIGSVLFHTIEIDTLIYLSPVLSNSIIGYGKVRNLIFGDQIENVGNKSNFLYDSGIVENVTIGLAAKEFRWSADTVYYNAIEADKDAYVTANEALFLGDQVEVIGQTSLRGSFEKIKFPESLKTIEQYAFLNARNLTEVECPWYDPRDVDAHTYVFGTANPIKASLYVPKGSKERYEAMEPWSKFLYIIEDSTTWEKPQCEMPTITYEDGKLNFSSETTGSTCLYTITDEDITVKADAKNKPVQLEACYHISAIATAEGYVDSEAAEATLYFIEAQLDSDALQTPQMRGVVVSQSANNVTISGLNDNELVILYTVDGKEIGQAYAIGGTAIILDSTKGVRILTMGNQTIKIYR